MTPRGQGRYSIPLKEYMADPEEAQFRIAEMKEKDEKTISTVKALLDKYDAVRVIATNQNEQDKILQTVWHIKDFNLRLVRHYENKGYIVEYHGFYISEKPTMAMLPQPDVTPPKDAIATDTTQQRDAAYRKHINPEPNRFADRISRIFSRAKERDPQAQDNKVKSPLPISAHQQTFRIMTQDEAVAQLRAIIAEAAFVNFKRRALSQKTPSVYDQMLSDLRKKIDSSNEKNALTAAKLKPRR